MNSVLKLFCTFTGKPVVVRKVIRNGQPEDDSKKDSKISEAKNQKSNESFDEVEKKEKPKLKPTIKLKVSLIRLFYHLKIYNLSQYCRLNLIKLVMKIEIRATKNTQ